MDSILQIKTMMKKLDDRRMVMILIAVLSAIVALDVLGRIIGLLGEILGGNQSGALVIGGLIILAIYVWVLYFLITLAVAAFKKRREYPKK